MDLKKTGKTLAVIVLAATATGCAINQFSFSYRSPDCTNTPSAGERYMNACNGWRNLRPLPRDHPKVKGYESFSFYTDSRGHTHIHYFSRDSTGNKRLIYDQY